MPQGHAGAPSAFVCLMLCAIAGLDFTRMYFDDATVFDVTPSLHVEGTKSFLSRLGEDRLKVSPQESQVGATTVYFLVHTVPCSGLRLDAKRVEALTKLPCLQVFPSCVLRLEASHVAASSL